MAEATKDTPQPAKVEVKATSKVKTIRSVYGVMVDPHTAEMFNVIPKPEGIITPWVQSQLNAGKLELT